MSRSAESSIVTKCALIVDLLTKARNPLGFSEIVVETGFVKSSCHRLLAVLQGERLVAYDADSRTYRCGPRLQEWTRAVWRRADLQDAAVDPMGQLRERTEMNVTLSLLDEDAVLYLRTSDHVPVRYAAHPGDRAPLHCTAAGKLFLAHMPGAHRSKLLLGKELERCTEFTRTDVGALERELEQIRVQSYASAIREEFLQVMGIAAPIRNEQDQVIAALSLWTLTAKTRPEELVALAPELKAAAGQISAGVALGGRA